VSTPRLADYLQHILTATERINEYTATLSEETFLADELVQDAVIRNIEIIGEASNRIGMRHPEFVVAHPEIPLSSAYQMRNAVAHGYFEVDLEVVWATVIADLPRLAEQVRSALREFSAN